MPPDGLDKYLDQLAGKKTKKRPTGDDSVARVLDDEFSKLGYGDTARLSILGDVGRENNWNRNIIFGGHNDPKNKARNRGIISWQGDRRTKLDNHLKNEGVLGRGDDDELRGMARFMDKELRESFPNVHKKLKGAKGTYEASEALRQYIKYVPDGPYNSYDPEFRVKNNADWAKRARSLGLGQKGLDNYLDNLSGDGRPSGTGSLDDYLDGLAGKKTSPTFPVAQPLTSPTPIDDDIIRVETAIDQQGNMLADPLAVDSPFKAVEQARALKTGIAPVAPVPNEIQPPVADKTPLGKLQKRIAPLAPVPQQGAPQIEQQQPQQQQQPPVDQPPGQSSFVARVDPEFDTGAADKNESVFRQAVRQWGSNLGRPLNRLEEEALVAYQKQTRGAFNFAGNDRNNPADATPGEYTMDAATATEYKQFLDENQETFAAARTDNLREFLAAGGELTGEALAQFKELGFTDEDLGRLTNIGSREGDDFMSGVQSQRNEYDKLVKLYRSAPDEDTKMNAISYARRAMGWITPGQAADEVDKYYQVKNTKDAELKGSGMYQPGSQFEGMDLPTLDTKTRDQQLQNYLVRTIGKHGTAANYLAVKKQETLAETARQNRVAQMSWPEYVGRTLKDGTLSIWKSAASIAIASSLRGIAEASTTLENLGLPNYGGNAGNKVSDKATYKAAQAFDNFLDYVLPTNKDMQGEILAGKLPQAIGSSLGMAISGAAKTPKLAIAVMSSLQMGGDGYKEAIEGGATEEEAQMYGLMSAPLGITEIFGIGGAINRLNKGTGGTVWKTLFREAWNSGKREVPEELAQEGFQTSAQNLIANLTYDPDRKFDKGVAEAMLLAGVSAGLVSSGVTALNIARNRFAINKLIKQEQANGVIIKSYGDGELYVFDQKVPITPELAPMVERYNTTRIGIEQIQDEIDAIQRAGRSATKGSKYAATSAPFLQAIWNRKAELAELQARQVRISTDIAERSGVGLPEGTVGDTFIPNASAEDIAAAKYPVPSSPEAIREAQAPQDQGEPVPTADTPITDAEPIFKGKLPKGARPVITDEMAQQIAEAGNLPAAEQQTAIDNILAQNGNAEPIGDLAATETPTTTAVPTSQNNNEAAPKVRPPITLQGIRLSAKGQTAASKFLADTDVQNLLPTLGTDQEPQALDGLKKAAANYGLTPSATIAILDRQRTENLKPAEITDTQISAPTESRSILDRAFDVYERDGYESARDYVNHIQEGASDEQKATMLAALELHKDRAGFKNINPALFRKADKANTVEEFIQAVLKADKTTIDKVSVTNLTEFFDRVKGNKPASTDEQKSEPAKPAEKAKPSPMQQFLADDKASDLISRLHRRSEPGKSRRTVKQLDAEIKKLRQGLDNAYDMAANDKGRSLEKLEKEIKVLQDERNTIDDRERLTDKDFLDEIQKIGKNHGLSESEVQGVIDRAREKKQRTDNERKATDIVRETRKPTRPTLEGSTTIILTPESGKSYEARYVIREAEDVFPSHNPVTFQPNPDYYYTNDRHYDREEQYQKQVIDRSTAFKPQYFVSDTPTAADGPPVITSEGNVLGGNSRAMILQRIYEGGESSSARTAYLLALHQKAKQFGFSSSEIDSFQRPILARELSDDSINKQHAITELNEVSTTDLTTKEQAVADAGKLTDEAVDYITAKIEVTGAEATLTEALNAHGPAIVNRLIDEGVFGQGERNTLLDDGKITEDGKKRIERLLLGKVFTDLGQIENTAPSVKNTLVRIISPLMKVNSDTQWNILPEVQEGIELLNEANASGQAKYIDSFAANINFLRPQGWSPQAIGVAKVLASGMRKATDVFKQYAEDMRLAKYGEGAMFEMGAKTQEQAYKDAFGVDAEKRTPIDDLRDLREAVTGKKPESWNDFATRAIAAQKPASNEQPKEATAEPKALSAADKKRIEAIDKELLGYGASMSMVSDAGGSIGPIMAEMKKLREEKDQIRGYQTKPGSEEERLPPAAIASFPNSLGIKRDDMPQIREEDHAAFIAFAAEHGITIKADTIAVKDLLPTQSEYNPQNAAQIPEHKLRKKFMVSQDDHILDGHNGFVRLLEENPDQEIEILRIPLKARQAIDLMRAFPKATRKSIGQIGPAGSRLAIETKTFANPDEQKVFDELSAIVQDMEKADALYDQIPDASGGKVIGTDIARFIHTAYDTREGRIKYTKATSKPAGAYAEERLMREILNPPTRADGQKPKLLFTAGGVASGKSSAVTQDVIDGVDLVSDGQMKNWARAITEIQTALDHGWSVEIDHVYRPFVDMLRNGAIPRAIRTGRWGSVHELPELHMHAQESLWTVAEHFKSEPGVTVRIWRVEAGTQAAQHPLKTLAPGGAFRYNEGDVGGLHETVEQELNRARELREYNQEFPDADHVIDLLDDTGAGLDAGRSGGLGEGAQQGNQSSVRSGSLQEQPRPEFQSSQEITPAADLDMDALFEQAAGAKYGKTPEQKEQDDAINGLIDAFGFDDVGLKSVIATFDEDRYTGKIEGALDKAFATFKAATPQESMGLLLDALETNGLTEKHIREMKPYIVRFMKDKFTLQSAANESISEAGVNNGTQGTVSSGSESDSVLGEVLPDVSEKPGEQGQGDGLGATGPVLSNLQQPDRPGDESTGSETASGDAGAVSTDSGSGSDLEQKPTKRPKSKSTSGDARRVVGTTGNYYVNNVDEFASGGLKTKFRNNVTAIETLRKIEADGRDTATPAEQAILAKYIGWGQFPALFNTYNEAGEKWDKERETLLNLISAEEFEGASASTKNAHYTAPQVVKTVWDIVGKLGFKGGNVVETSMGIGNFLYLMPAELRGTSRVTGIEIDPLSAKISKMLFPSYDIRQMGYEEFAPPKGFYDLAISNVPFGNYKVADSNMPHFLKSQIHNYFFAKSLENVRPGGLIAFITSTGTMSNEEVTSYLAGKADLVAAMRFPENTFLKDAGTAVVTDLVILRVKNPSLGPQLLKDISTYEGIAKEDADRIKELHAELDALGKDSPERTDLQIKIANIELHLANVQNKLDEWRGALTENERFAKNEWNKMITVPDPDGKEDIPLNKYYQDNPSMVLGRLDRSGTMYAGDQVNVSRTPDFEDKLRQAIDRLPTDIVLARESEAATPEQLEAAPEHMQQGALTIKDGRVFTREGSYLKERILAPKHVANITSLLKVRDTLSETQAAERTGSRVEADKKREELGKVYDAYVEEFGTIHDNRKLIEIDPSHYKLLALEKFDKKTKKVTGKSDIFTQPTVSSLERATSAASYGDAISIVLNQTGTVDIKEIARLMGVTPGEAGQALVEQNLAYNDPRDSWTVKDLYLSGEVRRKLREAKEAATLDDEFKPNVEALEKVQPEDKPYRKIDATLGAVWIPATDIKQFLVDMFEEAGQSADLDQFIVERIGTGDWVVGFRDQALKKSAASTGILGTEDRNVAEIVSAAIRDMPIVITRTVAGEKFVDRKASLRANKKVKDIRSKFKRWIWADDERRARLHRSYNDTYNDTTKTTWDGSHLTFPGMSPMWTEMIHDHSKNAVYRLLNQGRLLAAHEVGTGKTAIMAAGAMELRRLHLAKKPTIVCLNANIQQVVETAREMYPNAKILAAYQGMDAQTRQETTTRIATGDWDMVILTHENLGKIPMSKARQIAFINEEVQYLRDQVKAVEAAERDAGEVRGAGRYGRDKASRSKSDNRVVKALEAKIANREAKLKELFDKPKDDAITFEETGIDFLIVDEAHAFKNLEIATTRQGTKGIPSTDAQRATNMFLVSRYLTETNNNRGVAFFTGTPISNTTAEAFNMMRYLMYQDLKARGIHNFDSWAANYGENIETQEMSADGTYKPVTAFRQFKNIETLVSLLHTTMDVVKADDVRTLKRPNRNDEVITVPMSPAQKGFLGIIRDRAEALKHMTRSERMQKGADNWLALGTHAKWMAIDMRLVDPNAQDDPTSKANQMVRKILELQKANPGKAQLIFSNVGVNPTTINPGFRLYGDIIDKLVKGGIPRNKIIDFSKFKSGQKNVTAEEDEGDSPQKEEAMRRLNAGEAWIAIGSAEKLGTGVNVQQQVIAMHKLDVKQRPDQDEQETGRGWRDGNENENVHLIRYTTQDSFDMFFYDRLKQKKTFVDKILDGTASGRYTDSLDDSLDYDTVVALTASNPLIRERIEVMQELRGLENDYEGFNEDQLRLRDRRASMERDIEQAKRQKADLEEDRAAALEKADSHVAEIGDNTFVVEEPADIRKRLRELDDIDKQVRDEYHDQWKAAFKYREDNKDEVGNDKPLDQVVEAQDAEIERRQNALDSMEFEKANERILDKIRNVRQQLKDNYSVRNQILYRDDGIVEVGTVFGFPVKSQFIEAKKDKSLTARTYVELPSGAQWSIAPSTAVQDIGSVLTEVRGKSTAWYDNEIEKLTGQIPGVTNQLEEQFTEEPRLLELRKKLARIEMELGGETIPEGYTDVNSRMREMAAPTHLKDAQGEAGEPEFGTGINDQSVFIANGYTLVLGEQQGLMGGEEFGNYQNERYAKLIASDRAFVAQHRDNAKAYVAPVAADIANDTVIFTTGQQVDAVRFAPLYNAYPNAEFMVDGDRLIATENGAYVGAVGLSKQKAEVDEDLVGAVRAANFRKETQQEKRASASAIKKAQIAVATEAFTKRHLQEQGHPAVFQPGEGVAPGSLKSIPDKVAPDERMTVEEMKDLPYVEIEDILDTAEMSRDGSLLKMNAASHELLRRSFEESRIQAAEAQGKTVKQSDYEDLFGGEFLSPAKVEETIEILRSKAAEAESYNYPDEQVQTFKDHADMLEAAAAEGQGTVVVFILDSKLPHELFHQTDYIGAAEKTLLNRHTPEYKTKLDQHAIRQILWDKHYSKYNEYKRYTSQKALNATLRAEIPAFLLESTDKDLAAMGITPEMQTDYMLMWFEGYAAKNGIESLDHFDKEELDVQDFIAQVKEAYKQNEPARKKGQNNNGGIERSGEASSDVAGNTSGQSGPLAESSGIRLTAETHFGRRIEKREIEKELGFDKDTRLRSLPLTLRRAGIEALDAAYEVFHDPAAIEAAQALLDEHGMEGSIALLRNMPAAGLGAEHGILSFMLMKALQNHAASIRDTDPETARKHFELSLELAREHAVMATSLGQYTRVPSIVGPSVETLMYAIQGIVEAREGKWYHKTLTPEAWENIEGMGRRLESALTKVEDLRRRNNNQAAKIKRLEDEQAGKRRRRTSTGTANRKQLGDLVYADKKRMASLGEAKARRKAELAAETEYEAASQKSVIPSDGADLDNIPTLAESDPQKLSDFSEIGAEMLVDGLMGEEEYFPADFKAEMLAEYGSGIEPYFDEIYKAAWAKRTEWLNQVATEQTKERIENKYNEGEDLADWEVAELLGKEKLTARRRRFIEKYHAMTVGAKKPKKNIDAYKAIITDLTQDKSDATAIAAISFAEGIGTAEIHQRFVDAGVTKAEDQRQAIREGNVIWEKAKVEFTKQQEAVANEILKEQGELRSIDELQWIARNELQASQRVVADEIRRIKNGEGWYALSKVVNVANASRTMMASFDFSGALRQGGFFTYSKPEMQGKAFANMYNSLGEKGFGRAIQDLEAGANFVLSQRMGIDYAIAGKTDEGSMMGEELFRGDETIEHIPIIGKLVAEGIVKWSERTYTAFLDTQRYIMADLFAKELMAAGMTFRSHPEEFKKIGDFINIATGRGIMPKGPFAKLLMDLPLFAPRYTLSRFQLINITLNPISYANMPPAARKIIAKQALRFYGTTMGILGLAATLGAAIGASVNWDPDDDDFGKISVGNTKYDIFVGMLPTAKLLIKIVHSAIRTKGSVGDRVQGELWTDTGNALLRFVRGKLSPSASLAWDAISGKDYPGEKTQLVARPEWFGGYPLPGKAIYSRLIPLVFNDLIEAYKLDGVVGVARSTPLTMLGVGVSNYKPRAERPETEAEKLAAKMSIWNLPSGESKLTKEARELKSELVARSRRGEDVSAEVDAAVKAGTFGDYHKREILSAAKKTLLEDKAEGLGLDYLETLLRYANPDETAQIMPMINKKMKDADEKGELKADQRTRLEGKGASIVGFFPMPDVVKEQFDTLGLKIPDVGESMTLEKGGPKTKLEYAAYDRYRREALEKIYTNVEMLVSADGLAKTAEYQNANESDRRLMMQEVVEYQNASRDEQLRMVKKIINKQRNKERKETRDEMTAPTN